MPKSKKIEEVKGEKYEKGMVQCPDCFGNDESCPTCKGKGQVKK
jgi:hypothetical protein